MSSSLPRSFYARDTPIVARTLLGMRLVCRLPDGTRLSGLIVETEAYRPGDQASHAYRGRTDRNAAMYLQPGTAYVYFTYGMHYCLNIVTEGVNIPAAVLIRAIEPQEGIDVMQHNRAMHSTSTRPILLRDLCRGPARLCQALDIDKRLNAYDTLQAGSMLYIEQETDLSESQVSTSPRIGVFGDETARTVPWRWFVTDSLYVSRPPRSRGLPSTPTTA